MTKRRFGEIEEFPVGSIFANRRELSVARVHCPPVAGISGSKIDGADSIVISGGYEDDVDSGELIIYTGHGGNDPSTGEQIADQELHMGNKGLAISCDQALPVRVVRGRRGEAKYSPNEGFRYDGLYSVVKYWSERGKAGFLVWRFLLSRCDPTPPPWADSFSSQMEDTSEELRGEGSEVRKAEAARFLGKAETSLTSQTESGLQEEDGVAEARKVELRHLAGLLRVRNEVAQQITQIIDRPAQIGHIGEYIAAGIFNIDLCESAVTPGIDGYFRSGPLDGSSVNIKFYGKQESLLDIRADKLPDYFLVLTGPKSPAVTSRGVVRPWVIRHVYLFEANGLVKALKDRGVKIGVATSVAKAYWEAAEIYPEGSNDSLTLTAEQLDLLESFSGLTKG